MELMREKRIDTEMANRLWMDLYFEKGKAWLPVLTDSMVPLIKPGDRVLMSGVASEQIRRGDIIVFKRNGNLYVHRVLKKWRTPSGIALTEKGDGTYRYGRVRADDVIGRVMAVKSNQKVYVLTAPFGRLASRALSLLFYGTILVTNPFITSTSRSIRKVGKVLLWASLVFSSTLIRICSIIWQTSGLGYRSNPDSL